VPEANRTLRRGDHAIENQKLMDVLLDSALVGRIGVIAHGEPYVVPMNYAYHDAKIYIHGASEGRLVETIKSNPLVCFEIDEYVATLPDPVLCEFDTAYASVICYGRAHVLEDLTERTEALKIITRKYAPAEHANALRESTVEAFRGVENSHTAIIEIAVESMTGKKQDFNVQDFSPNDVHVSDDILNDLGNVPESYHHHKRVVAPGKPLELPGLYLKWYEVRCPDVIVPLPFIRETRKFIERELSSDKFNKGHGIGFVVLHDSSPYTYLLIGIWNGVQEMWETLYIKETESDGPFELAPTLGGSGPTMCVWEMTPIWHERQAWVRYLNSKRDLEAKRAYVTDQFSGLE